MNVKLAARLECCYTILYYNIAKHTAYLILLFFFQLQCCYHLLAKHTAYLIPYTAVLFPAPIHP